jgi:hypothetical protein
MPTQIDANQIWLLSPQLSVALLGMLVLGVDLLGRRRRLTWLTALIGLAVPAHAVGETHNAKAIPASHCTIISRAKTRSVRR